MKVCPGCNTVLDNGIAFCPYCGAAMAGVTAQQIYQQQAPQQSAPQQNEQSQPAFQQVEPKPIYQQPVFQQTYQQPASNQNIGGGNTTLRNLGFILSILGLAWAFVAMVYCFAQSFPVYREEELYVKTNLAMFFNSAPCAAASFFFTTKNNGSNLAKIFSIIGIASSGLHFILTFVLL